MITVKREPKIAYPKTKRLKIAEFYSIYGISLLLKLVDKDDAQELILLANEIAQKYITITMYAMKTELRHFIYGGVDCRRTKEAEEELEFRQAFNTKLLESVGLTWNKKTRNELSIDLIIKLFSNGMWLEDYGGEAWGSIAKACQKISNSLPARTVIQTGKLLTWLDHLNDLEHNSDLYLSNYVSFNLGHSLTDKAYTNSKEIIANSLPEVKKIAIRYRHLLKEVENE